MPGLSNKYIDNLMKICVLNNENFKGVLSCDIFLRLVKSGRLKLFPGQGLILNLSSSNHPGSHWVCTFLNENGTLEFFDSFGMDCYDRNILQTFKLLKHTVVNFKKKLQHQDSIFCGFFCIAWLLCREVNISNDRFHSFFYEKNLKKNDDICIEIIKKFIELRQI